jgi:PLP dependent protein
MHIDRLNQVLQRIDQACRSAGRDPETVRLLAVSKTHPAEAVRGLHELGQQAFGESYVDEAVAKIEQLADLGLEWHYIGPIQSNKTRLIARHFDWVQGVDRAKIIRRLADQRPEGLAPLNVLIQVNLDDEPQKAGCRPGEIAELADMIAGHDSLRLRGLMAIPAPREDTVDQKSVFHRLHRLYLDLQSDHPAVDTLSAGMSADLEAAIAEGSTMVRVGTALFGARGA